jgi:hypothetical protein
VPVRSQIRVFQDLVITGLSCDAHLLTVDVVDRAGVRNQISFHFVDEDEASDMADQVAHWHATVQPVTYVRTGNEGALIDERDAFERAFGDDFDDQCV